MLCAEPMRRSRCNPSLNVLYCRVAMPCPQSTNLILTLIRNSSSKGLDQGLKMEYLSITFNPISMKSKFMISVRH